MSHIYNIRPSLTLSRCISIMVIIFSACSLNIGDECVSSNQCELGQVCDLSSKDGYCTITPCTPTSCPNESVCVNFEDKSSYCMALCRSGDDCRHGYVCDTEQAAAPFCRVK